MNSNIIREILQNFCNHLTGRGSVRFNVRKNRIGNNLTALSMMIQNHNGLSKTKQFLALSITWFIGIHHHNHRIVIYKLHRFVAINKHRFIIIRILAEAVYNRPHRHCRIIHHNMSLLIQGFRRPVNSNSGADGVHV
ncbi:hypothetical protein EVA_13766 [gut metagenome]|uniref:Uncharacterized protein n=1 Tax=gut metagenome TaxID=749906 RepID=J9G8N9_9ZZZZ